MGLYLFYARVSRSKAEEYNYFSAAELEVEVTNWFKDYIQPEPNQEDSSESKEEVLYYSTLAYWTTRSALKSLFSAIANDSFFVRCSELFVLLPHLEPEARAEFQSEVIDKFVDGTDFVLVEW